MAIWAQERAAEIAARAAWPLLAAEAGLRAGDWAVAQVRVRTVRGQTRVLLDLDGPQPLILKHAPAERADWFDRQIAAHVRAETAFAGADGLGVPHLLASHRARRAWLMARVAGDTAHDLMATSDGAGRLAALRAVGRWMGHLHRSGEVQFGRIRPRQTLRRIEEWLGAEAAVPEPARFMALAGWARAVAEAARGVKCTRTVVHGDLNLRNLILDGDRVWGIDFGATALAPPALDMARCLVRHETFFGPVDGDPVDTPEAARAALLDGHGGRWRDATALDHLMAADLLRLWMSIPADPALRSLNHHRRWAGISRMAARLGV